MNLVMLEKLYIKKTLEIGGTWKLSERYDQRLKLSGSIAKHEYKQFQPSLTLDYSGNTFLARQKALEQLSIRLNLYQNYYFQS